LAPFGASDTQQPTISSLGRAHVQQRFPKGGRSSRRYALSVATQIVSSKRCPRLNLHLLPCRAPHRWIGGFRPTIADMQRSPPIRSARVKMDDGIAALRSATPLFGR